MILPHQQKAHESTESTCLPTKHNSLKSVAPISNMNRRARLFFRGGGRENMGIDIYQPQISIDNRPKKFCPSLAKWDSRFIRVTYRDMGNDNKPFCRWQLRKAASLVLPTWSTYMLVGSSSGQNLFFTAISIVPTALVRGFRASCLSLSFLCLVCIFYFLLVMSIPALSGKCSYFQEIVTHQFSWNKLIKYF